MNPAYAPPPGLMCGRDLPRGLCPPRAAGPDVRRLALPPADRRGDRAGAGLPRHADLPEPRRRAAGDRRLRRQARRGIRRRGRQAIRELAKCPNVVVKLGGMAMRINGFGFHEKAEPPSSEALAAAWRPYVETCIEAFGAARCMFESNFPVDKGSYAYAPTGTPARSWPGRQRDGENRPVQRHRFTVLPAGIVRVSIESAARPLARRPFLK